MGLPRTGSTPVPYRLGTIPSGEAGVATTLAIMRQMVSDYKVSPTVRTTALQLTSGCASRDAKCIVSTLHAFVRDQIRYVPDVRNVETVQTPDYTLAQRAGDCDDHSVLLASLLETLGLATRFCAVAVRGGGFSHVSSQVQLGTRWVNLETILPTLKEPWGAYPAGSPTPAGWFPSDVSKVMLAHN